MARPDYPRARWYGAYSGNYSRANRPSSNPINKVILHITEGSWSSAINWFKDSRAGVSAHYTVRSSDGFVGQSVQEKDIAYHAGNWPVNQTSVGIEHEGFGNDPKWMTDALYRGSARLSAYLVNKYNIPIRHASSGSERGFLFHRQVTSTHCPGQYFDITRYLRLVRNFANQGTSNRYQQSVDNANRNRFRASSNWGVSSWNSQRWGKNYHYARPANVRDNARFKVNIPRRGSYEVFARWPADPGYNSRTRFIIRTTNGWRARVINQRRNGGRWVRLGTFNMPAGDRWNVAVSRQSSAGGYVIADGVLVREAQ
jgi:N-acetyl-anhydromuramyl-L-alanine amidase AmpD